MLIDEISKPQVSVPRLHHLTAVSYLSYNSIWVTMTLLHDFSDYVWCAKTDENYALLLKKSIYRAGQNLIFVFSNSFSRATRSRSWKMNTLATPSFSYVTFFTAVVKTCHLLPFCSERKGALSMHGLIRKMRHTCTIKLLCIHVIQKGKILFLRLNEEIINLKRQCRKV